MRRVVRATASDGDTKIEVRATVVTNLNGRWLTQDETEAVTGALKDALMKALPELPYFHIRLSDVRVS